MVIVCVYPTQQKIALLVGTEHDPVLIESRGQFLGLGVKRKSFCFEMFLRQDMNPRANDQVNK
jgi:hypothetical protein